jgi:hypothetical protein
MRQPVSLPDRTFKNLPGFPETIKQHEVTTTPPPDALVDTPSDKTLTSDVISKNDPDRGM